MANTLASLDGGPARNAFELNIALNAQLGTSADLVWIRGSVADSVIAIDPHATAHLNPGPRKLVGRRGSKEQVVSVLPFARELRRADIVILHGYYLLWIPLAALLCAILRVPFVITPHGSLTLHQSSVSRTRKRLYEWMAGRWVRRLARGFVTGSLREAAELMEVIPDAVVAAAGVGTQLPVVDRPPVEYCDPLRLVSVSRIAPKKRIDLMIESVGILRETGLAVRLTVCGTGPDDVMNGLRDQAVQRGVQDIVEFRGHVSGDSKRQAFLSADFFLLPSDDENFGIGLAEALAHGVPSIVSGSVAAAEAMSPESGEVVATVNAEAIAQAIVGFRARVSRSRAFESAREDAGERLSWDAAARRWLSAVNELGACRDAAATKEPEE